LIIDIINENIVWKYNIQWKMINQSNEEKYSVCNIHFLLKYWYELIMNREIVNQWEKTIIIIEILLL